MPGMRILAAHPFPDLYGADLMFVRSVEVFISRGHEVTAFVPEPGPLLTRLSATGATVEIESFPVLRRSMLSPAALARAVAASPAAVLRLTRIVRRLGAEVLYVNTVTLPHWLAAARRAGRPAVCHVRESEDGAGLVARAVAAPLGLATAVIANSAHTARFVGRQLGATSPPVHVLHNGMDFGPMPPPWAPAACPRLAVLGRLNPRKGQDVAISALRLLHDDGRKVELDVVGSTFRGYEWVEQSLRDQARQLGLEQAVRFTGYQPAARALQDVDMVLVPSRTETFGNVAVEAMAAGRPIVASAVGGLPEIVRDGTTGRLVPPDDPAALAAAVAELLDAPGRAADLARAAAADVRNRFSMGRYGERLDAVVARAAGRAGSGRRRVLAVLEGGGPVGGVETSVGRLAADLARAGVDLEAAVVGPAAAAGPAADFLARWLPTTSARGTISLWRALGRSEIVHVHAPTCLRWRASLLLMARARGRPVVLTLHLPSYPPARPRLIGRARACSRFLARGLLLQVLAVEVRSPSLEAAALARRRFRPARVPVAELRNGVTDRSWAPVEERPGPLRAAFIGRLDQHKRPDLFVQAIALARRGDVEVHGVLAGDGAERTALEDAIAATGAPVRLLGAVEDPAPVMAAADVLVLPSLTEGGAPLVVQEAAAAGRPSVVRSSVEGMASWAGAFVAIAPDAGGPEFAAALRALASDRTELSRLGREARKRYEAEFTATAAAERLRRLYDTVASGGGP